MSDRGDEGKAIMTALLAAMREVAASNRALVSQQAQLAAQQAQLGGQMSVLSERLEELAAAVETSGVEAAFAHAGPASLGAGVGRAMLQGVLGAARYGPPPPPPGFGRPVHR